MQAMSPGLPVHISRDRTLRVKILDACGLTCTFCHNEGTPVAVDNHSGVFTAAGRSGRAANRRCILDWPNSSRKAQPKDIPYA